ncbi:MAG: HlyD family efflux transporter periplasmic adaptor subunit [Chloroflexi bacterium]|nr:HlyD family efflux transporter periplasmic adaptor subunit [Chloroflexota bacterium]
MNSLSRDLLKSNGLIAVLFVGAMSLAACAVPGTEAVEEQPPATAISTDNLAPVKASSEVISDAVVVPSQYASLSLPTAGIVAELWVAEGERVEAGDVLVQLNAARQIAVVSQAEASFKSVEARLAELKAGARPQEIAVAQAVVDAALAHQARLEAGARLEAITSAEAALAGAQSSLQKLNEGPGRSEIVAAQAEVDSADAARQQAQAAYDRVSQAADIALRPESLQLQQATNAYNAALARLKALNQRVTAADIAGARAQVKQARSQLDALVADAHPADLAAAQAEVERVQAQLDLLLAGARSETLAAAEADVASAAAALEQARAALSDMQLVAPFAGTIAQLEVKVGEQVVPGVAAIQLADLSTWQIETDDLTELDVVEIAAGDSARISFDAIPDLTITGSVIRVKDIGESKLGDITYTVVVAPDSFDKRLRWNMTAVVTID